MKSLIDTSLIDALQPKTGLDPTLSPGGGIGGGLKPPTTQPFVWGQGGARVSPEQLAMDREMAAGMVQEGTSSAPVGHWLQGANRVAQALLGGAEMRDIRKQDQEAQAFDEGLVDAIMGGDPGAISAGINSRNPAVARAAQMVWKQQHPDPVAPTEFERALVASGVQPGSPEWVQSFKTKVRNGLDPWTTIVSGGESLSGRQSLIEAAINGGGGGQESGGVGASPPPRPQGASDDQLISEAGDAISRGADPTAVFKQLKGWGVRP